MIAFAFNDMFPCDFLQENMKYVETKFEEFYNQYAQIFDDKKGEGEAMSCGEKLKQPPSSTVGKRKYHEFMMTYHNVGKVLSKMARDILSIPITTVASESTFSAGGRVISQEKASMRVDTIKVLLCGGDWIKEAYGIRSDKHFIQHYYVYGKQISFDAATTQIVPENKNISRPTKAAQTSKDVHAQTKSSKKAQVETKNKVLMQPKKFIELDMLKTE
ncbi:hypothetical protein LIER_43785 [Lithospermum erythrorhizon]|uniref:HAT C-terminal dimerisation domain-containing protein n=1 Tax=Lithospermum erythrorhizon TaxID=34254 RepID=A0AAV3QWA7_LITER